jgi:hypothetical protein
MHYLRLEREAALEELDAYANRLRAMINLMA